MFEYKLHASFLLDEDVLAYSLGYSRKSSLEHLKKIKRFHRLPGMIVEDRRLEMEFEDKIRRFLRRNFSFKINLERYRYHEVYRALFERRLFTYSELSEMTGYSIPQVIRALVYNPFLILIPCHRVIRKDGNISGYTPLGASFKRRLLRMEGLE